MILKNILRLSVHKIENGKWKMENGKWKIMVEKTIRKNAKHSRPTVFVYFRYIRKLLQNCMYGYYPPADNHAKICTN